MKKNDFFEAMNNIDAELIERADKKVTLRSRRTGLKIAAIAASFAIIVAGIAAILPALMGDSGQETPGDAIVWENVFELFDTGKGGGLKIQEGGVLVESSFSEIVSAKYEKYEIGDAFPLDKNGEFIGAKIDDIEARNGWYMHLEEKERDVVTVNAEVYEIKGVSPDAAVAVKYLEKGGSQTTEHYYVAVNTEYEFDSLSAFFDDFNAAVHLNIGGDVLRREYGWGLDNGEIEKLRIDEAVAADICKLIMSYEAEAEYCGLYDAVDVKMTGCDLMLRFSFSMASAGRSGMLYVFDNGYIAIRGIGEGTAVFNVGEECTDEIFATLRRSGELVTVIPASTEDPVLVEMTTSAPENEVVPE